MKRLLFAVALAVSALVLGSCDRDESSEIVGSYTYKTSGTVTVHIRELAEPDPENPDAKRIDTVVKVGLNPEQGQMHIVSTGEDGAVKVTFNDIAGNVDVADARISGNSLTISGTPSKEVQFTVDKIIGIASGIVTYTGSGTKYDRTLITDLKYEGGFSNDKYEITIVDSEVHCVAQSND